VSDGNGSRRKRLTTTEQGYGWAHQQARARLEPFVRAGKAVCTRCGEPIEPGAKWHLDHRDDRSGYAGAAHAYCNSTAPHRGPRRVVDLQDDEARGIYWGPSGRRWSRPWLDWRAAGR
jgi:hypothetical protein